jgi:nitrogen fixation NifU-like protein
MYSQKILEHFRQPHNVGTMEDAHGMGKAGGEEQCPEDLAYIWIQVEEGRIVEIRQQTKGCPAAIASSSMTTLLAQGRTLEEALEITQEVVAEVLGGIPERKAHSNLGPVALQRAIEDYRAKAAQ